MKSGINKNLSNAPENTKIIPEEYLERIMDSKLRIPFCGGNDDPVARQGQWRSFGVNHRG